MTDSHESARYALPPLQYTRGDVLIKLGHQQSDWLVVHSTNLSEASPELEATLSDRWAETIGIDKIKHPRTGEDVEVKTMALKYVEGVYFLEGKEVLDDLNDEAVVFQDTDWCSGWPQLGRDDFGHRSVLEMTKRAFRVLIATMHGVDLTVEQVAGRPDTSEDRKEGSEASLWLNEILFPQIVTVCAIAEYLGCLSTVGPAMMAILHSAPRFWQAVAYRSIWYLMLATRLKDQELYYDSYRHAAVQAYHNVDGITWRMVEAITHTRGTVHQLSCNLQLDNMKQSAANLKDDLHRLQTSAGQEQRAQRPQKTWSFFGITVTGPGYDGKVDAKEHYALIAQEVFGRWLTEHLYLRRPAMSPPRYRSEDLNIDTSGPHGTPALRFNLAVHRLEQAALSNNPTSIFGLSTPRRFASRCSLFNRKEAEEGIDEALRHIVQEARKPIQRFRNLDLTYSTVERAEREFQRGMLIGLMRHSVYPMPNILGITGGCKFDGHEAGYFTCLKIFDTVPFDTHGGCRVSKCELLDTETLLESQKWMDRVFEPMDETRQPFVLDKNAFLRIVYFFKFSGVVAFSLHLGVLLLSI